MTAPTASKKHPAPTIEMDARGRAWVKGTGRRVEQLVRDRMNGWSDADIHEQHPDLTRAEIRLAFEYYASHKEEVASQIAAADAEAKAILDEIPPSPFVERMEREGRLKR